MVNEKSKILLGLVALVLLSAIVVGLFSFFTGGHEAGLTLSYIAGLSMIFLPCTLPLAFIIVPVAMNESAKKGLLMALLFGLGMMVTFSIYGIFFSYTGQMVGLVTANVIAGIIGGSMAYIFGLSELGLIRMRIPGYTGALPSWVTKGGSYTKSFSMGLILANVGVGCPNPAFYVLLAYVIGLADPVTGWSVMAVHGIGRATPLILLAVLGILGVNATPKILKNVPKIKKYTAWGLVFIGAILFVVTGLFRGWYEESYVHDAYNNFVTDLTGGKVTETMIDGQHDTSAILDVVPQMLGPYVLILMLVIPIIWYNIKKPKEEEMGMHA